MGEVTPARFNAEPYKYMYYYNNLVATCLTAVLVVVLIFKRNEALRRAVADHVYNCWENLCGR
jgi:hypothetical protein